MKNKLGTIVKYWLLLFVLSASTMFSACGQKEKEQTGPSPTVMPTATETPVEEPTKVPAVQKEFEEFTNELFVNEIVLNTINLHYTLAYPELTAAAAGSEWKESPVIL